MGGLGGLKGGGKPWREIGGRLSRAMQLMYVDGTGYTGRRGLQSNTWWSTVLSVVRAAISQDSIREFFSECGEIANVRIGERRGKALFRRLMRARSASLPLPGVAATVLASSPASRGCNGCILHAQGRVFPA